MKLMLGTAQFGLDYGISNHHGKTPRLEVKKILLSGRKAGICFLDTAFSYGDSESVLGQFKSILDSYEIVTKLPSIAKDKLNLGTSFESSLARLGMNRVYGLMFHDSKDLLGATGPQNFEDVIKLKEMGKVKKIGVSVYTPSELKAILVKFPIDLVQVPLNIFDQRFLNKGFLKELKNKGIEIHARSIFLQGLLLAESKDLNPFFNGIKIHFEFFRNEIAKKNYSSLEVCLSFVRDIQEVDRLVVGVNDELQLNQLISNYNNKVNFDYSICKIEDETILLPSKWKLL